MRRSATSSFGRVSLVAAPARDRHRPSRLPLARAAAAALALDRPRPSPRRRAAIVARNEQELADVRTAYDEWFDDREPAPPPPPPRTRRVPRARTFHAALVLVLLVISALSGWKVWRWKHHPCRLTSSSQVHLQGPTRRHLLRHRRCARASGQFTPNARGSSRHRGIGHLVRGRHMANAKAACALEESVPE